MTCSVCPSPMFLYLGGQPYCEDDWRKRLQKPKRTYHPPATRRTYSGVHTGGPTLTEKKCERCDAKLATYNKSGRCWRHNHTVKNPGEQRPYKLTDRECFCGQKLSVQNKSGRCWRHYRLKKQRTQFGPFLTDKVCKQKGCKVHLSRFNKSGRCEKHYFMSDKKCVTCGKQLSHHSRTGYCLKHHWTARRAA